MANNNQKAAPAVEQQVTKTEAFFEKNKKTIIIAVAAVIIVVVGAILFKNYYLAPRANEASTELAKSQELFQQEQFDKALVGFQKVAADYSSTDAGNLAQLYIGLCQANLGKWQEAVNALESFSGRQDGQSCSRGRTGQCLCQSEAVGQGRGAPEEGCQDG